MSDSQRRLYEQMQELLVGFRAHTMNLGDLIENLPALLKQLEEPDQSWKDEYISYWWTLEQVHEDAIELGEGERMPPSTRTRVDEAVAGLERLVQNALASSA